MLVHEKPELVSDIIRQKKKYSNNDLVIYSFILKPEDSFLDLGANIGWYSLIAAQIVGKRGKVIAFEPASDNASLLVANKNLNEFSQIDIHQMAVSNKNESAFLIRNDKNLGDYQLVTGKGGDVETVTLDAYLSSEDFAKIKLVKIDIQGHEPQALLGMQKHLTHHKPVVILEFSPSHIYKGGGSPFEIFSFIEKNNYIPFLIFDNADVGLEYILRALSIEELFLHAKNLQDKDYGIDLLLIHSSEISTYKSLIQTKHRPEFDDLSKLFLSKEFHFLLYEIKRVQSFFQSNKSIFNLQILEAQALECVGQRHQANEILKMTIEECKEKEPTFANFARYKRVWHRLTDGEDFLETMHDLRLGRNTVPWGAYSYNFKFPRLDPQVNVSEKKILVISEGGQGDCFNHYRFCKSLKDKGAHVTYWHTDKNTDSLIRRSVACDQYLSPDEAPFEKKFDYWVGVMDLISAMGMHYNDFPLDQKILVNPALQQKWQKKLTGSFKIGLRWTGEAEKDQLQSRPIPFHHILDIVKNFQDIDFYSFEQSPLPAQHLKNFHDLSKELSSWEETAAALSEMNLVISSCTAIPHLAACLGIETWLVTPPVPYYAWAVPGKKSVWYKNLYLFRTEKIDAWEKPVKEIIFALDEKILALRQGKGPGT